MAENKKDKKEDVVTAEDTVKIKMEDLNGEQDIKVEVKKGGKRRRQDELEQELKELRHDLLRNQADFENYKKRMANERVSDRKYAGMDIVHDLLIPLDQLDKVVGMDVDDPVLKNYLIGFKMINDQIFNVLEQNGITAIESIGKQFDPKVHYATEKDCVKEKDNGVVLEEIQKGYMYKDRILRPAMVKVNEWSD